MTLFSFGQVVVYGGLNHAITRLFAIAPRYGGLTVYRACAWRKYRQVSLLWTAVLVVLAVLAWVVGRVEWAGLILVLLPYSLLNGAQSAFVAFGNAKRARRQVALHQAADAGLKAALVFTAAHWFGPTIPVLFAAYAAASLVTLLSLASWQARNRNLVHKGSDTEMRSVFSRFADPIYLYAPFTWCLMVADRWALQSFADTQALALYAVAAQMSLGPIRIGMSAVLRFLSPRLFDDIELNKTAAMTGIRRLTFGALGLTALIFCMATLFSAPITQLLVAPAYQEASTLLPWLVMAAGLTASAELVVLRQFGALNSAALVRPRITSAVFGGALIFLGAWQWGLWGVVVAQVLQASLFLGWAMLQAQAASERAV